MTAPASDLTAAAGAVREALATFADGRSWIEGRGDAYLVGIEALAVLVEAAEKVARLEAAREDAIAIAENIEALATGPWGRGEFTGDPSRLAVQVRHENFAKLARSLLDALSAAPVAKEET